MAVDLAEYVAAQLQATAAITDLIMDGAEGIFDSGLLQSAYLDAKEAERRESKVAKVLAVIVHDAGEKSTHESEHVQRVLVQLIDRTRSMTNIRTIRKEVFLALQGRSCELDAPYTDRSVLVQLRFEERTGHTQSLALAADYETLVFVAMVRFDLP